MSNQIHTWASRCVHDASDANYNGVHWTEANGQPVGSNLSPQADGVYPNPPRILVDLSHMASLALGRQMPQTATYRVTGITIGMQNCDDLDDNDRGAFFNGYINYYNPTSHRINAMKAARAVERFSEGDEMDYASSLFPPINEHYAGFRFGWSRDDDVDHQTHAGGVVDWTNATSLQNWAMGQIFDMYDEGMQDYTTIGGALWKSRCGATSKLRWSASINNADFSDPAGFTPNGYLTESPGISDYQWSAGADQHIEVMGGLLLIEVRQCNSIPNGDAVRDDYDFTVGVEVEGWSAW